MQGHMLTLDSGRKEFDDFHLRTLQLLAQTQDIMVQCGFTSTVIGTSCKGYQCQSRCRADYYQHTGNVESNRWFNVLDET